MRLLSITLVLLFVSGTLSGCISEEETERRFIDDDSELLDAEDAGVCGDLDGDGEMDCPLSGYIPDTMPWWCNSTGIGGHHVDPAYEGMERVNFLGRSARRSLLSSRPPWNGHPNGQPWERPKRLASICSLVTPRGWEPITPD